MHEKQDNVFFFSIPIHDFPYKTKTVLSHVYFFVCWDACMPCTFSVKISKIGNLVEQLYLAGSALQNAYKISMQASSLPVKQNQRKGIKENILFHTIFKIKNVCL